MIPRPFVKAHVSARGLVRVSFLVLALAGITAAGSYAQKRPESVRVLSVASHAPNYDAPASGVDEPAASDYVGTEACKSCHQNMYDNYEKTPHWNNDARHKRRPLASGMRRLPRSRLGSRRRRGRRHQNLRFKELHERDHVRCITCHAGGAQHMNALNSVHTKNNVSCISCHSPHHAETREYLLVKAQPELCYSCHLQKEPNSRCPSIIASTRD